MKKKDPPGYPGDEAIRKAFGEALRQPRLERGLSLEEADAVFRAEMAKDEHLLLPRALGAVVQQLREGQKMTRAQLSSASGLSARFIGNLERGEAHDATLIDVVRISFGLNHRVTDLVEQVYRLEKKLRST